jgi:NADPH-dependent curcumin reductase CurA
MTASREIRIKRRPGALPALSDFEIVTVDVAPPQPREIQVRNLFQSVDPWMVRAIREAVAEKPAPFSKFGPAVIGQALYGGAIGRVVASRAEGFKEGDLVQSMEGWRECFNIGAQEVQLIAPDGIPPEAYLGIAGMPGLTAFGGIIRLAKVTKDDVVFVTAAAGAVGSTVCQLAKLEGATVIGAAGGKEKAEFLREIGVDHVIDYRAEQNIEEALSRAAPGGTSIHFENVGGPLLAAGLNVARPQARIVLCGLIRTFAGEEQTLPGNLMRVIRQRWRILGLSSGDFMGEMQEFRAQMATWIKSGKIRWKATIDHGIENAPAALLKIMSGENIGKMLIAFE